MTRTSQSVVAALAILMIARGIYGYYAWHTVLVPDFHLYTQGGIGLFPTPPGRILGLIGKDAFAILSSISAGLLVALVGLYARSWVPSLVLLLLPIGLWMNYHSIDNFALLVLALGISLGYQSLVGMGAFLHLQLVPFALLWYLRRGGVYAIVPVALLLLVSAMALMATPYSDLVYSGTAITSTLIYGVYKSWAAWLTITLLVLVSKKRTLVLGSALLAAWECGIQHHANPRYFLPAIVVACATMMPVREWKRAGSRRLSARVIRDSDGRRWIADA